MTATFVRIPSPYVLWNGLGLLMALFCLESRLITFVPRRRDHAYLWLVLAVSAGWLGAHILAWAVGSQPFYRAGFTFYGGLIAGWACFASIARRFMSAKEVRAAVDAAIV